jgi:hypothetical protein
VEQLGHTTPWPKEGHTTPWPKEGHTTPWSKEGQTTPWPKEGHTILLKIYRRSSCICIFDVEFNWLDAINIVTNICIT